MIIIWPSVLTRSIAGSRGECWLATYHSAGSLGDLQGRPHKRRVTGAAALRRFPTKHLCHMDLSWTTGNTCCSPHKHTAPKAAPLHCTLQQGFTTQIFQLNQLFLLVLISRYNKSQKICFRALNRKHQQVEQQVSRAKYFP